MSGIAACAPQDLDDVVRVGRVEDPIDASEAAALLLDHVEWVRLAAGIDLFRVQPGIDGEVTGLLQDGAGARTCFLARRGSTAVGTVALQLHADGSAELKRMYVRPVARGTGVADALIDAVVDAAVAQGCHVLWLETAPGPMDRAIAVYRRHGFVEAGPERLRLPVAGAIAMERRLAGTR